MISRIDLEESAPVLDYEGVRLETVLAVIKVLSGLDAPQGQVQVVKELEGKKEEVLELLQLVAGSAGFLIEIKKSTEVPPIFKSKEALMGAINKAYRPRSERTGVPTANKLALIDMLATNMLAAGAPIEAEEGMVKLHGTKEFGDEQARYRAYQYMFQWSQSLNDIFARKQLPLRIYCSPQKISMRRKD